MIICLGLSRNYMLNIARSKVKAYFAWIPSFRIGLATAERTKSDAMPGEKAVPVPIRMFSVPYSSFQFFDSGFGYCTPYGER